MWPRPMSMSSLLMIWSILLIAKHYWKTYQMSISSEAIEKHSKIKGSFFHHNWWYIFLKLGISVKVTFAKVILKFGYYPINISYRNVLLNYILNPSKIVPKTPTDLCFTMGLSKLRAERGDWCIDQPQPFCLYLCYFISTGHQHNHLSVISIWPQQGRLQVP